MFKRGFKVGRCGVPRILSRSRTLKVLPTAFCGMADLSFQKLERVQHDKIAHLIRFHRLKAAFLYFHLLASEAASEDHPTDGVAILILCRANHAGENKRNVCR